MNTRKTILAVLAGLSVAVSVALTGCGDNGTSSDDGSIVMRDQTVPADMTGMPGPDLTTPAPDMGCYAAPNASSTHVEIINACTTSQQIPKNPSLPLLGDGGSLPKLP